MQTSAKAKPHSSNALKGCWALLSPKVRRGWWCLIPLGLAGAVLDIVTAYLLLQMVSVTSGIEPHQSDLSHWLSFAPASSGSLFAVICAVIAAKTALRMRETFRREQLSEATVAAFGNHCLAHWLGAPMRQHLSTPPAEITEEILSVSNTAGREGIASLVIIASEAMVVLALGLALALVASLPGMALLGLMGAIGGLLLHLVHRRHAHWGEQQIDARPALLGFVQSTIRGIREIRIGGTESLFLDRFLQIRALLGTPQIHIDSWRQVPLFLLEALFLSSSCLLLWLLKSSAGLPLLIVALYAAMRMLPAVNRLVYRAFALQSSRAAMERIAHAGANPVPPASTHWQVYPTPQLTRELELRDIAFTYPRSAQPALTEVNLSLRVGERLAIVGPSGHGKSTLLMLMAGLVEPDQGQLLLDGQPLRGDDPAWRRQIGFVGQYAPLLDDTLEANITLGNPLPIEADAAMQRALEAAQLTELIEQLPQGVHTQIGLNGRALSGGERQRVALARAFYRSPRLLLLDEATAFLDPVTEQAIFAAFTTFAAETTIVFVSHRLVTAARSADRIAFISKGRIEVIGAYSMLKETHPAFAVFAATAEASDA